MSPERSFATKRDVNEGRQVTYLLGEKKLRKTGERERAREEEGRLKMQRIRMVFKFCEEVVM